jgi:PAS domain S-box-containing protein
VNLKDPATLLDLTLEGSGLGIWSSDLISGETFWDERSREIFGVGPDESIDLTTGIDLIHPEDRPHALQAFELAVKPGSSGQYVVEKRILRRDGSIRWVSTRGETIFEGAGKTRRAVRLLGTVEDITARKQAEEQLAFQAVLLDQIQDAVVAVDHDERITYLNAAAAERYGVAPEKALELKLSELYQYQWMAPEQEAEARAALADAGRWQGENVHVTRSGETLYVESTVTLMRNDAGQPVGMVAVIRDITTEKRAENALARERELLQGVFDRVPVMLTVYDPNTQVLRLNKTFEQTLGWSTAEAARIDLMEKVYPDPVYREDVRAYMQSTVDGWREFQVTSKNGELVPSLWSNVRLSDDTLVGVGIDLRERKRSEQERDQVLARISDAFFALDREWRFTYVNGAAEAVFRKRRAELLGNNVWELFPEAVDTPFEHHYRHALETQQPVQFEAFYPAFEVWVDVQVYPSEDGLSIFFQDITERRQLRWEREEALALLDSLFESAPVGLGFWDRDLRFTRINRALAELNGLSPEAHIGKRPSELLPDVEDIVAIEALWRNVMESGEPILDFEVAGRTPASDERKVWREHFYPVRQQGDVIGLGAVVEDVTALKQAEAEQSRLIQELAAERAQLAELTETLEQRVRERTEQVRRLAAQLARAEQEERRRVARILHDHVQQMLYGIQIRIHLTEMELAPEDGTDAAESLAEIKMLIADAVQAVRTLSVELNPPILETDDVGELLQWLTEHMQSLHGLDIAVILRGAERPHIVDKNLRNQFFHITRELLFNVVKHAGVTRAEISVEQRDDFLQICVRDEGKGFDPAQLSAGEAGQRGLGLAGMYERLGLFDGQVDVRSAPGEGTQVTLLLPQ